MTFNFPQTDALRTQFKPDSRRPGVVTVKQRDPKTGRMKAHYVLPGKATAK